MNRLFLSFCFLVVCIGFLSAQSSAFVLIDVSGSVPKSSTADAQAMVMEMCEGKFVKRAQWEWLSGPEPSLQQLLSSGGLVNPAQDGYLMIMPMGIESSHRNHRVERIQSPQDIQLFFQNHYPRAYNAPYTFIDIARAMAASLAKGSNIGIQSYYLIEISDFASDIPDAPPTYTVSELKAMSEYGSSSANVTKLGTLMYNNSNYWIVISRVNVQTMNVPPLNSGSTNVTKKELTLLKPGGIKSQPETSSSSVITVVWKCLGCDSTTEYTVRARYSGAKSGVKAIEKTVVGTTTAAIPVVEAGDYIITVSATGMATQTGYVKVKGGSANGPNGTGKKRFPVFILLLAAAGIGYYFWRQRQSNAEDDPGDYGQKRPSDKDHDGRSASSRNSNNSSGGKSSGGELW